MPNKDRSFHESPQKAGGEAWLYTEQQQKLCHFKPDTATYLSQDLCAQPSGSATYDWNGSGCCHRS